MKSVSHKVGKCQYQKVRNFRNRTETESGCSLILRKLRNGGSVAKTAQSPLFQRRIAYAGNSNAAVRQARIFSRSFNFE